MHVLASRLQRTKIESVFFFKKISFKSIKLKPLEPIKRGEVGLSLTQMWRMKSEWVVSQWSSHHGLLDTETHFETQFQVTLTSLLFFFQVKRSIDLLFHQSITSCSRFEASPLPGTHLRGETLEYMCCLLSRVFRPSVTKLNLDVACRCNRSLVLHSESLLDYLHWGAVWLVMRKKEIDTAIEKRKKSYFYRDEIALCSNVLYLIMEPKRPRGLAIERWRRHHLFFLLFCCFCCCKRHCDS